MLNAIIIIIYKCKMSLSLCNAINSIIIIGTGIENDTYGSVGVINASLLYAREFLTEYRTEIFQLT